MPTLSLEEVRERIRKNFPKDQDQARSDPKGQKPLLWNRESVNTIVSECRRYRISRMYVKDEDIEGYFLSSVATPTSAPKHIAGPFLLPRDARQAAQDHANGILMQADLA